MPGDWATEVNAVSSVFMRNHVKRFKALFLLYSFFIHVASSYENLLEQKKVST